MRDNSAPDGAKILYSGEEFIFDVCVDVGAEFCGIDNLDVVDESDVESRECV